MLFCFLIFLKVLMLFANLFFDQQSRTFEKFQFVFWKFYHVFKSFGEIKSANGTLNFSQKPIIDALKVKDVSYIIDWLLFFVDLVTIQFLNLLKQLKIDHTYSTSFVILLLSFVCNGFNLFLKKLFDFLFVVNSRRLDWHIWSLNYRINDFLA